MFNPAFNTNFQYSSLQNTVPNGNTEINPYQSQYSGQNGGSPYMQPFNPQLTDINSPYNPYPNQQSPAGPESGQPTGYAEGGPARKSKKKKEQHNPYPSLAEMIRQQGEGEDKILAHINPMEAQMLGLISGGDINKTTGLPQFGLDNPGKWFKSVIGPVVGSIIGNMILPGVGGVIGGALGGAAGSKIRGRKDYGQAAFRGAAIGGGLPSAASAAGWGANALGARGVGTALSNYGTQNAVLPAIGRLMPGGGSIASYSPGSNRLLTSLAANGIRGQQGSSSGMSGVSAGDDESSQNGRSSQNGTSYENQGFIDSLMGKSKDFLSDPKNLLTTAVTASSFFNRPKEKTPEMLANEQKRYQSALMLNPEELSRKEAAMLGEEQMKRRVARNKFLPEERFAIDPVYVRTNTPEEYKKQKKWLNYYNNPEFNGNPLLMKMGGAVDEGGFYGEEVDYPLGLGRYIMGETKGQDDKIDAQLSDGEFVIPADAVADLGDGNNAAGAREFYKFLSNIRKHKRGGKTKLPPKAKSIASYMRG